MPKNQFRFLLLSYAALNILLWLLPHNVAAEALPQKLLPVSSSSNIVLALTMFTCSLDLIAVLGMSLFKAWARILFVLSTLLWLPVYFFQGVTVSPALISFLYDSVVFMSGLILALIYYSPLHAEFSKKTPTSG